LICSTEVRRVVVVNIIFTSVSVQRVVGVKVNDGEVTAEFVLVGREVRRRRHKMDWTIDLIVEEVIFGLSTIRFESKMGNCSELKNVKETKRRYVVRRALHFKTNN